jgi:galactosamine-6-phosphate isomerase
MQYIQYCDNYDVLSDRASEQLITLIQNKPDATICLATGGTPPSHISLLCREN